MNTPDTKPDADANRCPDCGEIHADEGESSSWPAWTDAVRYAIAPKAPSARRAAR